MKTSPILWAPLCLSLACSSIPEFKKRAPSSLSSTQVQALCKSYKEGNWNNFIKKLQSIEEGLKLHDVYFDITCHKGLDLLRLSLVSVYLHRNRNNLESMAQKVAQELTKGEHGQESKALNCALGYYKHNGHTFIEFIQKEISMLSKIVNNSPDEQRDTASSSVKKYDAKMALRAFRRLLPSYEKLKAKYPLSDPDSECLVSEYSGPLD